MKKFDKQYENGTPGRIPPKMRRRPKQKLRPFHVILGLVLAAVILGSLGFAGYKAYHFFFSRPAASTAIDVQKIPLEGKTASEDPGKSAPRPQEKALPEGGGTSGPKAATPAAAGTHDYSILIKKSEYRLYLLDNGSPVKSWGVALGKNPGQKKVRGDMKTPDGTFKVDDIVDASWWTHDFGDGKGEIKNAYGPWFISLDTYNLSKGQWDGIGIHGTHDPSSIGTSASEGCIRLENDNLRELKKYVKVGTKVTIEE